MKLWYSFIKELKLSSSSFYFYVEIAMAAIIILVLLVFIPENMSSVQEQYMAFDVPQAAEEMLLNEMLQADSDKKAEIVDLELGDETVEVRVYENDEERIFLFDTQEALKAQSEEDRPMLSVFVTYDEDSGAMSLLYYMQGYESERLKNLYKIINVGDMENIQQIVNNIEVHSLESSFTELNSREVALPSLLTFNGSLMGMFIIAAYIFLDKQEGIIKAYAVTASKVWHYLMSKVLVMTTVTIITTLAITLSVRGFKANYLLLMILLLTSSFFGSAFGLWISSFYDNMTKAFAAIYTAMMFFMLPAIAYFIPSWEPMWIKFIPTYYLINGFREVIIENSDVGFVLLSSLGYLAAGLLFFLISNYRFKKNLSV